ncbi:MAG: UpxY family transcription antiterminator [Bacteroidales bacterium]|jgi:transcription antitermination factor NusG|nr:UpxY family transcription antiterminator [Bacteroidales bacterium]
MSFSEASAHNTEKWYAMRVAYQQELKAKTFFDSRKIQNFIPMQYVLKNTNGNKHKKLSPAIHNLIFVKTSGGIIKGLKMEAELRGIPIRYIMDRATNSPMIVPDYEMCNFIAVAGTYDDQLIFLPYNVGKGGKIHIKEKVLITGGLFKGVEGYVVKIKKDRRILVSITGMCSVITSFVHPCMLEKIK